MDVHRCDSDSGAEFDYDNWDLDDNSDVSDDYVDNNDLVGEPVILLAPFHLIALATKRL